MKLSQILRIAQQIKLEFEQGLNDIEVTKLKITDDFVDMLVIYDTHVKDNYVSNGKYKRFSMSIPLSMFDDCWDDTTQVFDIEPIAKILDERVATSRTRIRRFQDDQDRIVYERLRQKFDPPSA